MREFAVHIETVLLETSFSSGTELSLGVIPFSLFQIEDLETCIKEEKETQVSLKKDLEFDREQLQEAMTDTEESKRRLSSLAQVQVELSNKLQMSMLSKARAEAFLEKAVLTRAETVKEIEELRRQRDVLRRRIEFCREKDTIGAVMELNEAKCAYRKYTVEDVRLATDDFSESRRIRWASHRTNIYRGRVDCATTVVIKMCDSIDGISAEAFERKVMKRIFHGVFIYPRQS